MKKKNPNKPHRPRSPLGIHAARRNAKSAPMKHRLEPKDGAKNDQPELLEEVVDDEPLVDDKEWLADYKALAGGRQDCICHMAHDKTGKTVVPGCHTHDPNGLDIEEEEHEFDL